MNCELELNLMIVDLPTMDSDQETTDSRINLNPSPNSPRVEEGVIATIITQWLTSIAATEVPMVEPILHPATMLPQIGGATEEFSNNHILFIFTVVHFAG